MKYLLIVFTAISYILNKATAQCVPWECKEGLGGSLQGEQRTCASRTNTTVFAENCQPDAYLCDVGPTMIGDQNCTSDLPFEWKKNMTAGDSCTLADSTCLVGNCVSIDGQYTCQGYDLNSTCQEDRQCNPGLFCSSIADPKNKTCQPVLEENAACNATARCVFGTMCANNKCTRLGSFEEGTIFTIVDEELFPQPDISAELERPMYWMCETFFAMNTNKTQEGGINDLFKCVKGPEAQFTEQTRTMDNLTCVFNLNDTNGETKAFQEYAICGFNRDDKFYCPKRRGSMFSAETLADRTTWNTFAPKECHHRTSIQYCPQIENNPVVSASFRAFLRTEWETTDDQGALVSNHDRCVGNAVGITRDYWRIRDNATSKVISVIALVAVLMITFIN
jgi:hypothetical protein